MKNYCIAVKEQGDNIVFLRKIVRGGADKSYGIQVAKLAGVPETVIGRAKEIANELTNADITAKAKEIAQDDAIIKELDELEISTMTPIDALNTLYRLQNKLKNRWKENG